MENRHGRDDAVGCIRRDGRRVAALLAGPGREQHMDGLVSSRRACRRCDGASVTIELGRHSNGIFLAELFIKITQKEED